MSSPRIPDQPRQFSELIFIGLCFVALGLLAVALVGSGGSLADDTSDEIQPTQAVSEADRPGLIGGGSLGGAERNPLGSGVENETNPFESQSSDRLFSVETSQSTYWRIDAYDEYSNGTWIRSGAYETYDPPLSPTGPVDGEHTVSITTEQDAAVLPTAWQPASITGTNDSLLAVSSETGIHTPYEYQAGSQYNVTAYQYHPDPRALVVSRANYPETIEERYTSPPEQADERITDLGNEITEDARTPVQAVCEIDDWITTNKEYDPTVTHDGEDDPLEQYLFEMDSGNAEYAASSLVVLARSQGIPARYVTGYSPGEQSPDAEDEYLVREANAHAWAEVYVGGHGWIPFDPTPSDERVAFEQQATGDGEMSTGSLPADCSLEVDIEAISDDQFSDGDDVTDLPTDEEEAESPAADADTSDETPDLPSAPEGTNVTIQTDPDPAVSGGTVKATVLVDGEPLSGGELSIDGQAVGSTDDNGTIEFTVPSELEPGIVPLTVQTEEFEDGQLIDVVDFKLTAEPQQLIGLPGETVTISATAGERPVSDVEIRDGDSVVGTTDENGEITVPVSLLPETTLEATYLGATTTTQIENRLIGLVLRGVGVLGIIGVVGFVANREYNLRAILSTRAARGVQLTKRLPHRAYAGLSHLPVILQAARRRGVWGSLLAVSRLPGILLARLRQRVPDSILAYLFALAIRLYYAVVRNTDASDSSGSADSESSSSAIQQADNQTHGEASTASTVRSVWQTFVRLVVRRISPTQTPGEIARTAIQKGFPRRPVLRLTNAFRTAAYGPTHSESLVDEAQSAFDALEPDREVNTNVDSDTGSDDSPGTSEDSG